MSDGVATVGPLIMLIMLPISVLIYILPFVIGHSRKIYAYSTLLFINIILGWNLLGWLFCQIWAVVGVTKAQDAYYARMATNVGIGNDDQEYNAEYARERARLDHEAAQRASG